MIEKSRPKAFVLIVEDDPGNRELTAQQLRLLGMYSVAVPGGTEAVEAVEQGSPILILMDFNMPGMNGVEACRAIRALPLGAEVPIVAVTADMSESTAEALLEAGVNEVIHRPVLLEELRSAVTRWVGLGAAAHGPAISTDADVLSRLRGGVSEESVQRIVGMYLRSLEERTEAISAAVRSGDLEALRNAAHALRSATSVFDAGDLLAACAELESLGDSGSVEGAEAHLGSLLGAASELRALLEEAQGVAEQPGSGDA